MLGLETLKYNFKDKKFVVFDFETSCLNLGMTYNKVWQATWLVYHGTKLAETHNYYLKWPDLYVSPGAARATRFHPSLVENGHDPKEILEKFNSYLYDLQYILVGQNVLGFDVYLHNLWRKSFGLLSDYSYIDRTIDTKALSAAYKLNIKFKPDESFIAQQYRFLNYHQKGFKTNLSFMCAELGIEIDSNKMHDAAEDTTKTFAIFQELVKKLEI